MTRRIYVAGGSSEAKLVSDAMARLREAGWVVTSDWTVPVLARQAAGLVDASLSAEEAARHALGDMEGVRDADVFWLMAPAQKSEGAWFECGYAFALGKRIVISGPTHNIFATCSRLRYESHVVALANILERFS